MNFFCTFVFDAFGMSLLRGGKRGGLLFLSHCYFIFDTSSFQQPIWMEGTVVDRLEHEALPGAGVNDISRTASSSKQRNTTASQELFSIECGVRNESDSF